MRKEQIKDPVRGKNVVSSSLDDEEIKRPINPIKRGWKTDYIGEEREGEAKAKRGQKRKKRRKRTGPGRAKRGGIKARPISLTGKKTRGFTQEKLTKRKGRKSLKGTIKV